VQGALNLIAGWVEATANGDVNHRRRAIAFGKKKGFSPEKLAEIERQFDWAEAQAEDQATVVTPQSPLAAEGTESVADAPAVAPSSFLSPAQAKLDAIDDWPKFMEAAWTALEGGKLTDAEIEGVAKEWPGGVENKQSWFDCRRERGQWPIWNEDGSYIWPAEEIAEVSAKPEAPSTPATLPAVVVSATPLAALASDWDEAVREMNKQHAVIENVGGKTVIASWEPASHDLERLTVVFQGKESSLLRHSHRHLWQAHGKGFAKIPFGQFWLSDRNRRQYRGVTFLPNGEREVHGCLNLWQGWGVEDTAGDWALIREHIERVIAGGNEEFAEYVTRWIAWSIQNPAAQAEVALVLIGAKGAGKGTLVRCLQRIFGAHAFQVTSREEVIGKFNGHLQDCVLFIADEAYWGGDKRCVGRLQGMITEPTLPIERKGIDLIQVRNYLHVVMLAEPGWVIPAGRYERRYSALAVSNVRRGDRDYFRALYKQIDGGGAEGMFHELSRMPLGDWHPREIPEALLTSVELQKQQRHTLPPMEQWFHGLLHDGVLPGALAKRPNTAYTRGLIDDAKERFPRLKFDLTDVSLQQFLTDPDRIGIACEKYRDASANGWSFAPLADLREAWCGTWGPVKWDNPAEEWSKRRSGWPQQLVEGSGG
jgi:hypothetical protein